MFTPYSCSSRSPENCLCPSLMWNIDCKGEQNPFVITFPKPQYQVFATSPILLPVYVHRQRIERLNKKQNKKEKVSGKNIERKVLAPGFMWNVLSRHFTINQHTLADVSMWVAMCPCMNKLGKWNAKPVQKFRFGIVQVGWLADWAGWLGRFNAGIH